MCRTELICTIQQEIKYLQEKKIPIYDDILHYYVLK